MDLLSSPHSDLKHMKTSKSITQNFQNPLILLNVVQFIMALCFKFVVVSLTNNVIVICTDFSLISQQHMLELE